MWFKFTLLMATSNIRPHKVATLNYRRNTFRYKNKFKLNNGEDQITISSQLKQWSLILRLTNG